MKKLNKKQQKIYDAIIANFPATKHISALEIALQGGINFQFISKS